MLGVFGVTAALVAYAPPVDVAAGPFSTNTTLGPLELEMTVEPARVGLNTTHLYLINAKDGTQFTDTKELTSPRSSPPSNRPAGAAGEPPPVPGTTSSTPPSSAPAAPGSCSHRQGLRIRTVLPHREGAHPLTSRRFPNRRDRSTDAETRN